jgi:hypothetical protein
VLLEAFHPGAVFYVYSEDLTLAIANEELTLATVKYSNSQLAWAQTTVDALEAAVLGAPDFQAVGVEGDKH